MLRLAWKIVGFGVTEAEGSALGAMGNGAGAASALPAGAGAMGPVEAPQPPQAASPQVLQQALGWR